jgi:hypothetical protein
LDLSINLPSTLPALPMHPTKKQLLSYTMSLGKKSNLHCAYDAARELLGKIKINSIGPSRPIQHRPKQVKDNSPLKIVDEKSNDDRQLKFKAFIDPGNHIVEFTVKCASAN